MSGDKRKLPPTLFDQIAIVAELERKMAELENPRQAAERQLEAIKMLPAQSCVKYLILKRKIQEKGLTGKYTIVREYIRDVRLHREIPAI